MNRRALLIASFALLAGCATAPPRVSPWGAPMGELEPLYSAQAGHEALVIRVGSNGCTQETDFAFYVERKATGAALAFGRKRLDPCRSFVMGKADLAFSYAELGLDGREPVFLLNPMVAWTGPGD